MNTRDIKIGPLHTVAFIGEGGLIRYVDDEHQREQRPREHVCTECGFSVADDGACHPACARPFTGAQ